MLTDHNNLTNFLTKKTLSGCDTHWWKTLSAYHLKILHRLSRLNPANAPSRWPDYEQVKWSNQPPSAGCKRSPDGSSRVLSVNRSRTLCNLSTCLLGTLGLAGTGDREHLMPCSGCTGGDMSEMAYVDMSDNFQDILHKCSQETNWPRSTVSGSTQGHQRSDRCCCLLGRSVTRFRVVRKKTCSGTSMPTVCYATRARSTCYPQVMCEGQSFGHIMTTPWLDTSVTRGLWNSSGASTTGLAWQKIPAPMSPPATCASASR